MTCILGRELFSLIIEGYCDFIQATIRRFELPLALQPSSVATEKLSVYDEDSFMRRFRTTVQSTGTIAEQVMTVCHVLFSFIGFETRGERLDVGNESRTMFYHISNFPDLEFELRVEAVHRTEPDSPNMMVILQWRRPNENWQLSGFWSFCFENFFRTDVVLPSNFEEIEDSEFLNTARYAEFRDSMQVVVPCGTEYEKTSLVQIQKH
ncbi:uncharacterized protein EV420DRAFT_1139731 [Desarmillaria tabescens]|uniref:Uncharacterized protein n=1 Tax=Armillaria tabescens TaxID=1929756 RepID=A0AA39NBY5_ARMTA|nr:uncharacterized protein EV420DRAFT_1139731 [Desarmillaria tabescens]KAK0462817.1 hypothetical protein EV420DRAFT_1139731 [Desarmillaria tabescens]